MDGAIVKALAVAAFMTLTAIAGAEYVTDDENLSISQAVEEYLEAENNE